MFAAVVVLIVCRRKPRSASADTPSSAAPPQSPPARMVRVADESCGTTPMGSEAAEAVGPHERKVKIAASQVSSSNGTHEHIEDSKTAHADHDEVHSSDAGLTPPKGRAGVDVAAGGDLTRTMSYTPFVNELEGLNPKVVMPRGGVEPRDVVIVTIDGVDIPLRDPVAAFGT